MACRLQNHEAELLKPMPIAQVRYRCLVSRIDTPPSDMPANTTKDDGCIQRLSYFSIRFPQ